MEATARRTTLYGLERGSNEPNRLLLLCIPPFSYDQCRTAPLDLGGGIILNPTAEMAATFRNAQGQALKIYIQPDGAPAHRAFLRHGIEVRCFI